MSFIALPFLAASSYSEFSGLNFGKKKCGATSGWKTIFLFGIVCFQVVTYKCKNRYLSNSMFFCSGGGISEGGDGEYLTKKNEYIL